MNRVVVDKNDKIIGAKNNLEIDFSKDIYRVTALWLWNSKGQVLIAQRLTGKGNDAGLWGPSVAGTVEDGESYDENIRKETEEEIGVRNVEFTFVQKDYFDDKRHYFCKVYKATKDLDEDKFVIQKTEVEAVKWMYPVELRKSFSDNPEIYLPSFRQCLGSLK